VNRPDGVFSRICNRDGWYAWLGWILMPAGWLFGALAALRRMLLESHGRKVHLPTTVVSVGNIEVGGTGKTPVTIWLARRVAGMGYSVAVVARNFGRRKAACRVRLDSVEVKKEFTDEVLLLAESLLGKARVYSGKSKKEAAARAYRDEKPDVIIVDDGFQHLGLHRDIELVVLDFASPFGTGGMLPSGTLREFPSFLSRAHHIWINRIPIGMSAEWIKRRLADYNWKAPVQFSRIRPTGLRLTSGERVLDIPREPLLAFCGIGRPGSFRNSLQEAGIKITGLEVFPDHHEYTQADMDELGRILQASEGSALITTEKDGVKLYGLRSPGTIYVQTMNLEVEGSIPELLEDIQYTVRKYRLEKEGHDTHR